MTITVSYSELDTFRQCPFKHQLAYRERWQQRPDRVGPALQKGTLWHSAMEEHYRVLQAAQRVEGGVRADEVLAKAARRVREVLWDAERGEWRSEYAELIEWIYEGYVANYGIDENWKILAVEHSAECWLPTPRGTRSQVKLKMKLDLVVREVDTGHLLAVDHKSGRDLPKDKELDIDDQFGLYTWGMRSLGKPVFGSMFNAARAQRLKTKAQPLEERFSRTPLYRTEEELDAIAIEAYKTARRAYGQHEEDGDPPRAPDSDRCKWRCDFTDACLFGRKVGNDATREFLADTGYTQNFERH